MATHSEENYLKTIYHLSIHNNNLASTNAIAEKMNTKAPSVTDMIKKLADKKLVDYTKYQGVSLTRKGSLAAISVIRKHRLWEVFLVNVLNFSWDEVHEVAEQLEHIKSEKLINEIDAFLNFPKNDPHGDPIPNKEGVFTRTEKILLSNCTVGTSTICIGVKDSSGDFLKYLDKHNITLGSSLKVIEKEPFDHSLIIDNDGCQVSISQIIATNLYVKII